MTQKILPLLMSFFLISFNSYGAKTCSRIATVNFQKVLVDTSSSLKGEGLRFYLEKDPIAKHYLDKYQKGNKSKWINAAIGTTGALIFLSSFFVKKNSNDKTGLMIGGAVIMGLNFLVHKTISYQNEENLQRSIFEYNKRNLPKIEFSPYIEMNRDKRNFGAMLNYTRSF